MPEEPKSAIVEELTDRVDKNKQKLEQQEDPERLRRAVKKHLIVDIAIHKVGLKRLAKKADQYLARLDDNTLKKIVSIKVRYPTMPIQMLCDKALKHTQKPRKTSFLDRIFDIFGG